MQLFICYIQSTMKEISYQKFTRTIKVTDTGGIQQINEESPFVILLNPDHFLSDVLTGAADTADRQEQIVLQKISRQHLTTETK